MSYKRTYLIYLLTNNICSEPTGGTRIEKISTYVIIEDYLYVHSILITYRHVGFGASTGYAIS